MLPKDSGMMLLWKIISARHEMIIGKWKEVFGEISFYC
jgi:hypothetical protein